MTDTPVSTPSYDETHAFMADLLEHKKSVAEHMATVVSNLLMRAAVHDFSKAQDPELSTYAAVIPEFKGKTYGTPEYRAVARKLGPAWKHHSTVNSHHPEAHKDGIAGMTLLDLLEMVCDWSAASKRGKLAPSINMDVNVKKFGIPPALVSVLLATMDELSIPYTYNTEFTED